jgi:hypothetical protein
VSELKQENFETEVGVAGCCHALSLDQPFGSISFGIRRNSYTKGPPRAHALAGRLLLGYYLVITDGFPHTRGACDAEPDGPDATLVITWLLPMDSHTPGALVTQSLMVTGARASYWRRPSHHRA